MRRWLLTTALDEDLGKLRSEIAAHGAAMSDTPPVPLGQDEQALAVEGPDDLPARLEENPAVRKVSPDSDVELY